MSNKFTEREIGKYVNDFYRQYNADPNQTFLFDFSKYEWISNQNLLLISSIIKYLYRSNAKFKIKLFKTDINAVTKKQARTIIQLWEVWKLYEIFNRDNDHFENYIEYFENSTIPYLKNKHKIFDTEYNIFNRLGITPFVTLNFINDYKDENLIETEITPIFELNDAIKEELGSEKSDHPFVEHTLSLIITREIYENFLDHYQSSFFNTSEDVSFLSISLKRKLSNLKFYLSKSFLTNFTKDYSSQIPLFCAEILDEIHNSKKNIFTFNINEVNELIDYDINSETDASKIIEILKNEDFKNKQYLLEKSFNEEELEEGKSFFKGNYYRNESYIQYSFIDYGQGIPTSISDEYCKENKIAKIDLFHQPDHNELLKFAFKHYTSRFPIIDKLGKTDKFIPRGLFDILTIAKRYQGLLIIRSNFGKLLYNFRNEQDFEKAVKIFGNQKDFFPGTYITLYIPELQNKELFDKSAIRYISNEPKKKTKPKNINLFNLLGSEFISKANQYNNLISKLINELANKPNSSQLNYISFFGIEDRNIITKTLFFLLTNYEINQNNSVLIMHPPDSDIIKDISLEIEVLNATIKNFRIHPLPLIRYTPDEDNITLDWLGVYNKEDKKKLDDLLFEDYSLHITDFLDSSNIKGNVISSDKYGNINGSLPNREILTKYYHLHTENLVNEIIKDNKLLKSNGLYLCNGNYYQKEFLQMSELLDNSIYRNILASAIYDQILISLIRDKNIREEEAREYLKNSKKILFNGKKRELKYIAVTSSSHKILKSLLDLNYVYKPGAKKGKNEAPFIKFDNYLDIESSDKLEYLEKNTDYIIICDAISTGNLVKRLESLIAVKENSELLYVATFVNNLDIEFENTSKFNQEYSSRIISLLDLPITKYRLKDLVDKDFEKTLIRINPFTNLPIEFSESSSLTDSILIYQNEEFLKYINDEDINIRFEIHNNLIHPYYFNIGSMLELENEKINQNQLPESLIFNLLVETKRFDLSTGDYVIFYPKDSGIDFLNKNVFNSKIASNHTIQFYELERFPTESGWKFPHSSAYFEEVIKNKSKVLILDDGTCSGNSLYQMINEISYFEPNQIDLLCLVSRIDDYKREFLSRLKRLRKHSNSNEEISVNIYYGAQWHIPTFYLNENPYSEEINWLNQILEFRNTPSFIRRNASKILKTIDPKTEKTDNYRYFPKDRDTQEIPKKDILLTRNEIGKLSGYRFYSESFDWYNQITFNKNTNNHSNKDDNRQIELIAMCLLYEPYLYSIISKSFPDIRMHLEQFIEKVFFEIDGTRINLDTDLYYDWTSSKKDLIHLFFIVYKDHALFSFLQSHKNLLGNFLAFAGDNDSALNYILYKFSFYFPIKESKKRQPYFKVKNAIQDLLSIYPSSTNPHQNFIEKIKRFRHFTASLVSSEKDDSFENSKSKIENYFDQINNPVYHKTGLNNDKTLILAHFRDIGKCIFEDQSYEKHLILLKERLDNSLYPYVNQILSFSLTYREYFIIEEDFNNLNTSENSLRGLLKILDNIVLDSNARDYEKGLETVIRIYSIFFDENFFLYKTIEYQTTKNLLEIINNYLNQFSRNHPKVQINKDFAGFDTGININIPKRYAKLIIEEIINNFRHSSKVNLSIKADEYYLSIEVNCTKTTQKSSGTSSGFALFENLKNNQILNSDSTIAQEDENTFHQILKFKIIK